MASCFNPWFSLSKIDWLLVPCSGSWCVQFSVLRLSKSQRLVIWICQLTYRYKYYTKTLCNFFVCLFFFLSFCTFGTRSWVVSFIVAIYSVAISNKCILSEIWDSVFNDDMTKIPFLYSATVFVCEASWIGDVDCQFHWRLWLCWSFVIGLPFWMKMEQMQPESTDWWSPSSDRASTVFWVSSWNVRGNDIHLSRKKQFQMCK